MLLPLPPIASITTLHFADILSCRPRRWNRAGRNVRTFLILLSKCKGSLVSLPLKFRYQISVTRPGEQNSHSWHSRCRHTRLNSRGTHSQQWRNSHSATGSIDMLKFYTTSHLCNNCWYHNYKDWYWQDNLFLLLLLRHTHSHLGT